MDGNQKPLQGGISLVLSLAGPLAFSISLVGALWKAYEMSACTGSFWQAPLAIQKVRSDQYLNAEEIVAYWRRLGWLPAGPCCRCT